MARQRAVELGAVVGNDYVVKSGLTAGDRLIVSGVQKIGDGAPVMISAPAAPAPRPRPPPGQKGRASLVLRRLHPPPDPRHRRSLVIILAGAISIPRCRSRAIPSWRRRRSAVTAFYTGANAQAVESAVTTPLEQVDQRRRGHDLHAVVEHQQRRRARSPSPSTSAATPTWPRSTSRTASTRRSAACRPTSAPTASRSPRTPRASWAASASSPRTTATTPSSSATTSTCYVRDAIKRVPGVGDVIIFGERKYAMRLWLDPARLAARGLTAGDVVNALREQNVQVAAGALGDAPAAADQMFNLSVRAQGRLTEAAQFADVVVQGGRGRRAGAGARRRPRRAGRRDLLGQPALPRPRGLGHGHPAAAVGQRARGLRRRDGGDGAAREELPARPRVAAGLRQRDRRARVDHRGAEDAGRGASSWSSS